MYIGTGIFIGLAIWLMGFALMTAGWLVDVLLEGYGIIPSKILYKTGAIIVATPVIYFLWKASGQLYSNRLDIVLFLRQIFEEARTLLNALGTLSSM